jgi:hypothetical protein
MRQFVLGFWIDGESPQWTLNNLYSSLLFCAAAGGAATGTVATGCRGKTRLSMLSNLVGDELFTGEKALPYPPCWCFAGNSNVPFSELDNSPKGCILDT